TTTPTFTCLSCHVAFATADQQRNHYRTDWHRYNLKRKVAELAPVSAEDFAQRALARQAQERSDAENAALGFTCNLCAKTYNNENGYKNHLASKKHRERAADADIDTAEFPTALLSRQPKRGKAAAIAAAAAANDAAAASGALADAKIANAAKLDINDCLFCNLRLPTMEDAIDHMASAHSFFIPDMDFLMDLPGLLTYLGEKIAIGNACLWCYSPYRNGHEDKYTHGLFKSMADVRKHMDAKGHCKIAYEDGADLEVADYYDFSSTWEGIDEAGADGDADAEIQGPMVDETGAALILPSGRTVGHRDVRRHNQPKTRPVGIDQLKAMQRDDDRARNLGTYADQVRRAEQRSIQAMQRREYLSSMRLGHKSNKLQKFFREQVL
ncbi:C2H2 type zinc-finger-domain-containing protein, partial [Blastocladiella britannica]